MFKKNDYILYIENMKKEYIDILYKQEKNNIILYSRCTKQ